MGQFWGGDCGVRPAGETRGRLLFGGNAEDRGERVMWSNLRQTVRSNEANAAIALSEDGGVADEETEADAVEEGDFAQVNDELAQVAAGVMEDSGFERLRLFAANDAAFALDDVNAAADAGFQFQGIVPPFYTRWLGGQAGKWINGLFQVPKPHRHRWNWPSSSGQRLTHHRNVSRSVPEGHTTPCKRVFQSGGSTESKIDFTRRGAFSLRFITTCHRRTGRR